MNWPELSRRLDLAGLRRGEDLGPPFPASTCLALPVELRDEAPDGSPGPVVAVTELRFEPVEWTSSDGLEAFLRLSTAEEVAAYAGHFGLLGLCAEHGLPYLHGRLGFGMAGDRMCQPEGHWERAGDWLRLVRAMRTALELAAAYQDGEEALSGPDVRASLELGLGWPDGHASAIVGEDGRRGGVSLLRAALDQLLALGGVRPTLYAEGPDEELTLRFAPGDLAFPLAGLLTRDLVFAAVRSDGVAICDGCARPYLPARKPRRDRLNFCKRCRDRAVPERIRKRRQRARES